MSGEPIVGGVRAEVEGRYLLVPAAGGGPAPLVVGFHGYGESAEASLRALAPIPGVGGWHRAAIQALHPFYNTRSRQVVASWMTSLDREQAIVDNARYVAAALDAVGERVRVEGPTVLAGFSQGTAMTYRAAALSTGRCLGLIALGGDLPPELAGIEWRSRPRVLVGRGRDDEWYDEAKLAADVRRLEGLGLEVTVCRFDGGHEWTEAFYHACGELLAAVRESAPA
ncbi:MAG: phospholipase [Thermoanaerobaculia bacterium]|nr:phospholipase [Thermoanaerobaculia bacterium]